MPDLPPDFERNIFINCPYDEDYQPLFEAIVFAVQLSGFNPRCALQASSAGQVRFEKIIEIIGQCKYGIHDISRTELSRNKLPRFNMAFELGIDQGCLKYGAEYHQTKKLLVMDRTQSRYQKFISDISGIDIREHRKRPRMLVNQVRDWISDEAQIRHLPGGDYMYSRYKVFQKEFPLIRKLRRLNKKKITFNDLADIMRVWLEEKETKKPQA